MNNLEDIHYSEVVSPQGLTYEEFRKSLSPDYQRAWIHIGLAFAAIAALLLGFSLLNAQFASWIWITIPLFSLGTGFFIAFLNLFVHEAAHYHLHPNKKTNDLLANIFLCSWVGLHIKAYRKIHWHHHQHLSEPEDSENSYFRSLSPVFLFETLSGIHLLRIIRSRNKTLLNSDLQRKSMLMIIVGISINTTILTACVLSGNYALAAVWGLSLFVFFPFFAALRQLLEHRTELATNDNAYYSTRRAKISRLFNDTVFSRLFGPAGFNKHMIHHWDPQLPFTALTRAEQFLAGCPRTKNLVESSRTSYFKVMKKLWRKKK